jgi:2-deoxy-scyllo-inosamine dehydrogenase (SAM-dependent)
MITKVEDVRIQLSNVCDMSHKKCPVSVYKERKHLQLKYVTQIIYELSELGYEKSIGFHCYNEPMIDPRLYYIMDYTRKMLPKSEIIMWTNGKILTKELLLDFSEIGNIRYYVSGYGNNITKETFNEVGIKKFSLLLMDERKMDDRLYWYDSSENPLSTPCSAPYKQLSIDYMGNVIICCMDWRSSVVFGNIKDSSLIYILNSEDMKRTSGELAVGIRSHKLCMGCRTKR